MSVELLIKYVVSPIVTALGSYFIKRYTEAKPNLITYLIHASAIPLNTPNNQQPILVNSHSIVIRNIGKKSATNVRIGHFQLLPNISFQLTPNVSYQIINQNEILVPTLVPNEDLTISYLYFAPTTWQSVNSYTKCDECLVKYVSVVPTIKPNKLYVIGIWVFFAIGFSTVLTYLTLKLLGLLGIAV